MSKIEEIKGLPARGSDDTIFTYRNSSQLAREKDISRRKEAS
ncbi:MAG: hypothetical protein OP8BY_0078 [Candidatus Saccharicenans subterraneus]|uniref:Uncharacterized protein n=1 Tax=Candidatus Saccharicenans subterraneus TaxID=2508984 RepID=A0A3E2BLT5_9BACT|nr:MAG: hypothetical protein OP8BY_0078 [Candidatus Saccharicenans subterraneum]